MEEGSKKKIEEKEEGMIMMKGAGLLGAVV